MAVSVGLGALAQGFATGLVDRKKEGERQQANARADRMIEAQIEISRNNAEAAKALGAIQPPAAGGYGGGLGIRPESSGSSAFAPVSGPGGPEAMATQTASGGPVTFAELLAKHEGAGNYDTLFSHAQKPGGADGGAFDNVRISQMSIADAIKFSDPKGPYAQWVKGKVGRVATPMGAGQIVGTTLRNATQKMGLAPSTPFNAETQDKIIDYLASQRLSGQSTMAGKRAALRAEWEGYKHVPDSQLDAAIIHFENTRGAVPSRGMGVS